jgi:exodeoxyribonuclease VII small subunit
MAESSVGEPVPERYEEIVQRLGKVVERLESGGLSLEDAVRAFEEGIKLARAGAARLDDAERRVELLLEGDRTQPFDPAQAGRAPARAGRVPSQAE